MPAFTKNKSLYLLLVAMCCFCHAYAQNFTTKGVEFWAGYGNHANMYNEDGTARDDGGTQKMVFYFLSNKATSVTVEIPALGWKRTYQVTASAVTETEEMPKVGTEDARLLTEGVSNKGIHITSDDKITAYCHIYDYHLSSTSLLIPVNISGQEYYSLNYTQRSYHPLAKSYCFVIATEDATQIEVTPSVNTATHAAGIPFTQTLNKGEILNLFGESYGKQGNSYAGADMTGTYVRSVNTATGQACKKIIVFSGSSSNNVMCEDVIENTSDNMIQQVQPLEAWGTNFIGVPTAKMPLNKYRVVVIDQAQKVYAGGKLLTDLIGGRYYEFASDTVCNIFSDTLMMVAQYITTSSQCGNTALGDKGGDPDMVYLSPLGNGISSVIGNATAHYAATTHYINVVIKTNDIKSFSLDGQKMPDVFKIFSRNKLYATAQISVAPGRHVLSSDSSFNAYAYGYGELESYSYNMGFSLKHVNGDLGIRNPYASPPDLQTCNDNPFRLYFDIAERITNMEWRFYNNANLQPNKDVVISNVTPDSMYQIRGDTYYRYYLPGYYTYKAVAQLNVDVLAYVPDIKGCITQKLFNFVVDVTQKPEADWALTYNPCTNGLLQFKNVSKKATDSDFTNFIWDFGDATGSTEKDPQKQYADYGVYTTMLRAINTIGCYDDTIKPVGLYRAPVANFSFAGKPCTGEDIAFTDASTMEGEAIKGWNWNYADGNTSTVKNSVHQFAKDNNYKVILTVTSTNNCTDTASQMVTVEKSPAIKLTPVYYAYVGDAVQLKPEYDGNLTTYLWQPALYLNNAAQPYPISTPPANISYTIKASGSGTCNAIATTKIVLHQKLDVPNVFSPNGDGINDTWRIKNLDTYPNSTVQIFDRWGALVYENKGIYTPWNGSYKGRKLPVGTYYYIVDVHESTPGYKPISGSITIIK